LHSNTFECDSNNFELEKHFLESPKMFGIFVEIGKATKEDMGKV